MTADEIRKQFILSKQALQNYLNLGLLTPVPGTDENSVPLYYTDEVAVIREALTTCNSSIKRLISIREKVVKEIVKTNATFAMLKLDEAFKESAASGIIDAVALFIRKAVPNLDKTMCPLYWLECAEESDIERMFKGISYTVPGRTPQDYCNDLYHEVEAMDVTSLLHIIDERDALEKENLDLKDRIKELEEKIKLLEPSAEANIVSHGYGTELSEKQVEGLSVSICECGFTVRVVNCLKSYSQGENNILTLKDVVPIPSSELCKFRNFGKNSLTEIISKLAEYDLALGMDIVEINGKYYQK